MSKLRIIAVCGLAALSVAAVQAQTTASTDPTGAATSTTVKKPLSQGISSVNKNLEKNPDNKGLQNAAERLQENQERLETRKAETHKRVETAKLERLEKPVKMERPEKVERPEKPSRSGR